MKYFKYWVLQRADPSNESDCCYVRAENQDAATHLSEKIYSPRVWLRVREIADADLPENETWIQ